MQGNNIIESQVLIGIIHPFPSLHVTVTTPISEPCMAAFCHNYCGIHASYLICPTLFKCLWMPKLLCMLLHGHSLIGTLVVLFVRVMRVSNFRVTILIHGPSIDHLWEYTPPDPAHLNTWGIYRYKGTSLVYVNGVIVLSCGAQILNLISRPVPTNQ